MTEVLRETEDVRVVLHKGVYGVEVPKYVPEKVWVLREGTDSVHETKEDALSEFSEVRND